MTEQLREHLPPVTKEALGAMNHKSNASPCEVGFTDIEADLHDVQEYEVSDDKNSGQPTSLKDIPDVCKIGFKGNETDGEHVIPPLREYGEAIYMEASATDDEVIRAGGFGATDDISSLLPVASDFTDFEAHLRDVEDYEDLEKDTTRPGLGWTNDSV